MNFKTFQKSVLQAGLLLSFLFLISSCSKDDSNSVTPDNQNTSSASDTTVIEDVWMVYLKGSDTSRIKIEVIEYGNKRFCYDDSECISVLDDMDSTYIANSNEEVKIVASLEGKVPVSVSLNNLNILEGEGSMRLAEGKYIEVDGVKSFVESETLYTSPILAEGYIYSFKHD